MFLIFKLKKGLEALCLDNDECIFKIIEENTQDMEEKIHRVDPEDFLLDSGV